jgi:phosphoribosylglycinamide formyltransferase 1
LEAFAGRIMNVHPSLLPAFPGLRAWEQALKYGVRMTGCTVHFVNEGIDAGPVILQQPVPVFPGDTPETLHQRIQIVEHTLLPDAIRLYAAGKLKVDGRIVKIL